MGVFSTREKADEAVKTLSERPHRLSCNHFRFLVIETPLNPKYPYEDVYFIHDKSISLTTNDEDVVKEIVSMIEENVGIETNRPCAMDPRDFIVTLDEIVEQSWYV